MKKQVLMLPIFLILCSCNNSSISTSSTSSSSVNKVLTVEDLLKSIDTNYSVNYTSSSGRYNIYRTENYLYDEELGGGQFVLYDDTMYVYTLHNNVVVPRVPYSGTKETFDNQYPAFNVNLENFEIKNGVYYTEDEYNLEQLSLLINSTSYNKASLFIDNGLLNFRFFDNNDKVLVTGKVFGINNTKVASLENYLNEKIDPELEIIDNAPLYHALGNLNDNFTFIGQNNTTKAGVTLLVNENYVASFSGTQENKEDYYGYISLNDGLHMFEIENGLVNVDFEISEDKDFIKDNYPFKRHDFSKFKCIEDNTYISSDYYNVQSFCDLLTLDGTNINLVKLKINETNNSVDISLSYNHYEVYKGTIFDIEDSAISELNPYLDGSISPDLEHFTNELLVEATKDLDLNFTYVNEYIESEDNSFYGIYSTEDGRKEYKSEYNNFPPTDYIVYEEYAYSYVLDNYQVSPLSYERLTNEEYNSYYSFKSIDFTHFKPLGNNKWMTNSRKYMNILSKILGSNPYDSYHHQATIELKDDVLYFEIMDTSFGTNTKGYLKDINSTTLDLIDEYKSNFEEPSNSIYNNSELIDLISPLRDNTNFTIKYHDDPEYGLYFSEEDYDYWTEEVVYFGSFEAGFITSSKSEYVYEYAMLLDEETNHEYLAISDHPSFYLNSISDFNAFRRMTNEQINSFMPYQESSYISFDDEIIEIFVDVLQLGGASMLGYNGVILDIINNELVISIIDIINVSYEDGKRNEEYEIFASATIINVGNTVIPSFAKIPTIK